MGLFRVLIYGIIFGVYTAAIVYDVRYIPRPVSQWWVSKLVMLSMINLTLQCVYSAICLICALFDWKDEIEHRRSAKSLHVPSYWRQSKLHRICDFLYSTSVFPAGMATCILFWSLYAVNPSFVMPKWVVRIIPAWLNHVTHTAPAGFLLIDTLLTCHHAPSRWLGSVIVFVLYIFYVSIILGVRLTEGYWLYPVFEQLQNVQITLLLTLSGVLFWFLYLIGDGLNVMLWGRAPHSTVTPTGVVKGVKQK